MIAWLRRRAWLVELPLAALALAAGLPPWMGLASGLAPADWRVPFDLQAWGGFGLRTTVYLSGFLIAFAVIELVAIVQGRPLLGMAGGFRRGTVDALDTEGDTAADPAAPGGVQSDSRAAAPDGVDRPHTGPPSRAGSIRRDSSDDDPDIAVSLVEPFYGFLPAGTQQRIADRTGYNALLYTKVSILLSAGIGVLLAGSWDPAGPFAPFTRQAAVRIGVGLYLIAESVHRYIRFARKEPSGSLIGALLHAATAPLHRT